MHPRLPRAPSPCAAYLTTARSPCWSYVARSLSRRWGCRRSTPARAAANANRGRAIALLCPVPAGMHAAPDVAHCVRGAGAGPARHAADGGLPRGGREDTGVLRCRYGYGPASPRPEQQFPCWRTRMLARRLTHPQAGGREPSRHLPSPPFHPPASQRCSRPSARPASSAHAAVCWVALPQVTFKADGPLGGMQVIAGGRVSRAPSLFACPLPPPASSPVAGLPQTRRAW